MLDILVIVVLWLNIVLFIMSFADDYLISKLFSKNLSQRKARIIYFDDFSWYKCDYDISVIEYEKWNGVINKGFVRRKGNDKIGNVITIASNDVFSVRPEVYKKMDMRDYEYIYEVFGIVISIIYLKDRICFMTIKEVLIYLVILIILFFGYIGIYYLNYKNIINNCLKH